MKQKLIIGFSLIGSMVFFWWVFSFGANGTDATQGGVQSVKNENGIQVIRILARGGYRPRRISAAAGQPTRLEVETQGTYDCSSSLVIPSIGFQKQLPSTGITNIDVPAQPPGSQLHGLCAMGMFSFGIEFN